jgi:hypothetical protein
MKSINLIAVMSVSVLTSSHALGQSDPECCDGSRPEKMVFRVAATHESIMEGVKRTEDPILKHEFFVPEAGSNEVALPEPQSIVERSDILHYGDMITLVPKRAVIHLPDGLRGVRGKVLGKRLVNWPEFYRANRSWIDTVEVTRAQAEGREPLSEELIKSFQKRTKAVVAVLQGGPISVLPVKEPETPVAEASTTETP